MAFKLWNKKRISIDRDAKMFYHYSISHKTLCKALVQRIKLMKDAVILVTGSTGVGKSTLATKLCFEHFEQIDNLKVPGEKMYTDENFIVDPEDYASRMIIDKGSVLLWDESRDGLSSKNWNKEINKTIVSRKNKNRKRGIISFILLPYEGEVDKSFLKHVTMWIWIKKRGLAQVFVASNSRMGGHGLSIPIIIDRQEKWLKENPRRRIVPAIIHQEYIGTIVFGALTKAQEIRYNGLVEKHHATGKLSEEEEEKINPMMTKKEIETQIPLILDEVAEGKFKNKREMWDKAKELTSLEDKELIAYFNRHLKIRGLKRFDSFQV